MTVTKDELFDSGIGNAPSLIGGLYYDPVSGKYEINPVSVLNGAIAVRDKSVSAVLLIDENVGTVLAPVGSFLTEGSDVLGVSIETGANGLNDIAIEFSFGEHGDFVDYTPASFTAPTESWVMMASGFTTAAGGVAANSSAQILLDVRGVFAVRIKASSTTIESINIRGVVT